MPFLHVDVEPFTTTSYKHLMMYSSKTQYLQHVNEYELELYKGFDLVWLLDDGEVVGYALMKDVKGDFFYQVDDYEEIVAVTNKKDVYIYLAYFEILRTKQDQGYGSFFLKFLCKQYEHPVIVYTTEDSVGFWLDQGFKEANYSDWWLSSKELSVSARFTVAN